MNITVSISEEILGNTLITAIENGSTYWCEVVGYRKPAQPIRLPANKVGWPKHAVYPLSRGGGVRLRNLEEDGGMLWLTHTKVRAGVKAMAAQYPQQFAELLTDSGDANTADLFLQCCLFGKEIYA